LIFISLSYPLPHILRARYCNGANPLSQRLINLRTEVDAATECAKVAEGKVKVLKQTLLECGHDLKSLEVRLAHSNEQLEKAEEQVKEMRAK
jgi:chromosome segregation ATPase